MSRDYVAFRAKKLRLMILRWLREGQSYTMDTVLLQSALGQQGLAVFDDELRLELAWLQERGFVVTREEQGLLVAELKPAGLDVADGRARHKEIDRPRPGAE